MPGRKPRRQFILRRNIALRTCSHGIPERTRTSTLDLRRVLLYPIKLRGHMERVTGVEPVSPAWKASIIATIRYPLTLSFWSGWRDSNSRPPGPKPGALPTVLHPVIYPDCTCRLYLFRQEISMLIHSPQGSPLYTQKLPQRYKKSRTGHNF